MSSPRFCWDRDHAELHLTGRRAPEAFNAIARLAVELFKVPVALISIVEEERDRQFFVSQEGLPEPWASLRQTPLTHSFCRTVKDSEQPLRVRNARDDPRVCTNLGIQDLNVVAYLGVPIGRPNGEVFGALCVVQDTERDWTDEEVAKLQDLARCVNDEIELRVAMREIADLHAELKERHTRASRYNAMRESITQAFMLPDLTMDERFMTLLRASCAALQVQNGTIAKVVGGKTEVLFTVGAQERGPNTFSIARSMAGKVICDTSIQQMADARSEFGHSYPSLNLLEPRAYIAAPLILGGMVYGILEFSCAEPRVRRWNNEDLSVISAVTMLSCSHLGVFGRIDSLRQSESALLNHLIALRHSQHGAEGIGPAWMQQTG